MGALPFSAIQSEEHSLFKLVFSGVQVASPVFMIEFVLT